MLEAVRNSIAVVEVDVDDSMTATLDGRTIHPVYATFWLAYHAEVAARRAIEPFFEPGENAVGGEISLRHEAMAAIGDTVTVEARVTEVDGKKVVCTITARSASRRIGSGQQVQIVMSDEDITGLIHEAQALAQNSR